MFSGGRGLGPVRKGLDTDPVGQSDPRQAVVLEGRERLENPTGSSLAEPTRFPLSSSLGPNSEGDGKMWAWLYGGGQWR